MKRSTLHCLASSLHRFIASPLHCFTASSLHRFIASLLHRFIASSCHRFIASSLSTLYEFMQKSLLNNPGLLDPYVKAKTTKFIGFATEITEIYKLLLKLPMQIIASMR
jgi:hypothetical protein